MSGIFMCNRHIEKAVLEPPCLAPVAAVDYIVDDKARAPRLCRRPIFRRSVSNEHLNEILVASLALAVARARDLRLLFAL